MLEIKILKTTHAGIEEARKLIPHIVGCSIYSLETSLWSEADASMFEREWKRTLVDKKREDMMNLARSMTHGYEEGGFYSSLQNHSAAATYMGKSLEYAHRNKRPIYISERFNGTELTQIGNILGNGNKHYGNAERLFNEGKLEQGVFELFQYLQAYVNVIKMRDQNIARNLLHAEELIRRENPDLAKLESIKLTIQIGAMHKPELHCNLPTKVIDLTDKEGKDDMYSRIYMGADFSSVCEELTESVRIK